MTEREHQPTSYDGAQYPIQQPQQHRSLEPYPGQPGFHGAGHSPYQQPYASPTYAPSPYAPAMIPAGRPPVSGALVVVAWIVAFFTLFYMLPWAVAVTRNRSNMAAIGLLNFFLGWSFIGWVVSLVMACGSEPAHHVVVVNQQGGYYPQR